MNLILASYAAILFFLLTPSILLRLPKKGGKYTVAAIHAVVFAIVLYFTGGIIMKLLNGEYLFREGFKTEKDGSIKFKNLANTYSDGCGPKPWKSCPGVYHVGRLNFKPSSNTLTDAEIKTLNDYKVITGNFSKTPDGKTVETKNINLITSTYDPKKKKWILPTFDANSSSQALLEIDSKNSDTVFITLPNNIFGKNGEEYTLTVS